MKIRYWRLLIWWRHPSFPCYTSFSLWWGSGCCHNKISEMWESSQPRWHPAWKCDWIWVRGDNSVDVQLHSGPWNNLANLQAQHNCPNLHACMYCLHKKQRLQHCLMFNYDLLLVLDLGKVYIMELVVLNQWQQHAGNAPPLIDSLS